MGSDVKLSLSARQKLRARGKEAVAELVASDLGPGEDWASQLRALSQPSSRTKPMSVVRPAKNIKRTDPKEKPRPK